MTIEPQLQRVLLEHLGDPRSEKRLAGAGRGFQGQAKRYLEPAPSPEQVQEAAWALVSQGLAYLDTAQPSASNWEMRLTAAGRAVLMDEAFNPHDPAGFLRRLATAIPDMGTIVSDYMGEALGAYNQRLYLASTVMLGAASEAAFLDMARAFSASLSGAPAEKFGRILQGKSNYIAKVSEFRKRVEPMRPRLPREHADGMALMLDSVLDLLRVNRNDAGHPTGRRFDRDDCFTGLQMAARYLKRMYGLKAHFEQLAGAGTTVSP